MLPSDREALDGLQALAAVLLIGVGSGLLAASVAAALQLPVLLTAAGTALLSGGLALFRLVRP